MREPSAQARHYGMDWLRIAAFGLLILYHVGMVFVPWNFHVNAIPSVGWMTLPMLLVNPWRLSLLFLVSGYASRRLFAKSASPGAFVRNRSFRLLLPLGFGIAFIVPPQPWVELMVKAGYRPGYAWFWGHDYWRFATRDGLFLPAWNHLWFVAYLWVYTVGLVSGVVLLRRWPVQAWFDRVFGGWGAFLGPLLWLVAVHGWWFAMAAETHALIGDWVAHASYLPALLFGFGLAGSKAVMAALTARWKPALATGVIGYATIFAIETGWAGAPAPGWIRYPYGIAHALQQWGAVVALIALAERKWNRDAPLRPLLTEAVFPFYLIHQTIIVIVMFGLIGLHLPTAAEFAILVAATVAGCWLFYLGGRAIGPLRPLIGLRRQVR